MIKYKKSIIFLLLILIMNINLCSCSLNYNNKPYKNYYSNKILDNYKISKVKKCTVVETNIYKEITLSDKDIASLISFFKTLDSDSFIDSKSTALASTNTKPCYMIFIDFNLDTENKYVINVYSADYVSVFPWDGNYEKDTINMSKTYSSLNLYNLCSSITK